MSEKTRVSVSLKDFLRVAIVERTEFDTHEKAAAELGLTLNSFKQRLSREKKNYPKVFDNVPRYSSPKKASEDEALKLLEELKQPAVESETQE